MKKRNNVILKAGISIFVVVLFLLMAVPANASVQKISSEDKQKLVVKNDNSNEPLNDDFWKFTPSSGLFYAGFPLIARILHNAPYYPIQMVDWSDKTFPRPTLVWLGSGIGVRPTMPIAFILMGEPFGDVELYSDGELYATIRGMNAMYIVVYQQKGFHHLKFVPVGFESDTLEIDIQVGFNGFIKNILPYLT